jgi:hypothetical protein
MPCFNERAKRRTHKSTCVLSRMKIARCMLDVCTEMTGVRVVVDTRAAPSIRDIYSGEGLDCVCDTEVLNRSFLQPCLKTIFR